MMKNRKIIHVDMDAFFAAIEQRNNPELRGKPVIVGGPPGTRSVVSTCSYEARKYGIHSAMSSNLAYKLCPHAIFVSSSFSDYGKVSKQIREIFYQYSDDVEPLSLDEAYIDVSELCKYEKTATSIAKEILKKINEKTELTASAGVSYNKFLAKVASDYRKPSGLTIITPERSLKFLESLPVGKFFGVGKKTEERMKKYELFTGGDIKNTGLANMIRLFGKMGIYYYNMSIGVDNRPVVSHWERKSIGKEITLREDVSSKNIMLSILKKISEKLSRNMLEENVKGRTVNLKIKFSDFQSTTKSLTVDKPVYRVQDIDHFIKYLLRITPLNGKKVRLLGISISNFDNTEKKDEKFEQLMLDFG